MVALATREAVTETVFGADLDVRDIDHGFVLHGESKRLELEFKVRLPFVGKEMGYLVQMKHLSNVYRVGRGGELRELSVDLFADLKTRELDGEGKRKDSLIGPISGHVEGKVRDGHFAAHGWYAVLIEEKL